VADNKNTASGTRIAFNYSDRFSLVAIEEAFVGPFFLESSGASKIGTPQNDVIFCTWILETERFFN
jgi:hypothetical protein